MDPLTQGFEERLKEIEAYLDFLENVERQIQGGTPRIGADGPVITTQQQRILYSSVFLQLYNLVEATVTRCLDAVCAAAAEGGRWRPEDLSVAVRREWVRCIAQTHSELNYENRLKHAFALCDQLIQALPVAPFKVSKGSGNWDDNKIETISNRLGFSLGITPSTAERVKKHFRDDKGTLAYIKYLRNHLAHGKISFVECGEGMTVRELRELKDRAALYLREVVCSFQSFINNHEFLLPDRRPTGAGV